jgi:hypothetical protein
VSTRMNGKRDSIVSRLTSINARSPLRGFRE